MRNIIIGTAGHIDHGKTALIRALTGRNTDRWKEEQERGITIDLGFTWFDLPDGNRAGIIDVPGHERFIHNMVAGVVGMDMVLLVIAADEGVMPQTREHMAILGLLGVKRCIVVLNKIDLVEEEWLDLVEEEIREEFAGTFLEQAPVVRVSSETGEGLDALVDEIVRMAEKEIPEKEIHTICRLPIDRVFTIQGFGTIVTGTLISGKIVKDNVLELYPGGKECRVRGIQIHGADADACYAGQRTALNLSGVRKEELRRGCVLAPVNSMKNTALLDVKLKILPSSERVIPNRCRLHLYTGTSEILCRAILLDRDELGPGEECYAQLRLEEELAVRRGDRFVVRFYSPMETVGGGEILEPNPTAKRRFRPQVLEELQRKESGSSADVVRLHVKSQAETMSSVTELAKLTALSREEILEDAALLEESGQILKFEMKKDFFLWPSERSAELAEQIISALQVCASEHPYRHGLKKAEIQMRYFRKMKPNLCFLVLDRWEQEGIVSQKDEYLCLPGRVIPQDAAYQAISSLLLDAFTRAGYDFLKFSELDLLGQDRNMAEDILMLLREDGQVVRAAEDVYTIKDLLETAAQKIRRLLDIQPVITIGDVRDLCGTSRKNAKYILAYTDARRITRNTGAESEWKAY